jgi:hypothetical protein
MPAFGFDLAKKTATRGGRGSLAVKQRGARSGRKSGERKAPAGNLTKPEFAHKIVYTLKLLKSNEMMAGNGLVLSIQSQK